MARAAGRDLRGKRHTKVYLGGRMAVLPRHGRKELPPGTLNAIRRQLGLKGVKE
jgi:hypothetical protein